MKVQRGKAVLRQFGRGSALVFRDWLLENGERLQELHELDAFPGSVPLADGAVLALHPPESHYLEPYLAPGPEPQVYVMVAYLRYADPDLVSGLREILQHRVAYVHGNMNARGKQTPRWLGLPCRTVCCFEREALLALLDFLTIDGEADRRRALGSPVFRWPRMGCGPAGYVYQGEGRPGELPDLGQGHVAQSVLAECNALMIEGGILRPDLPVGQVGSRRASPGLTGPPGPSGPAGQPGPEGPRAPRLPKWRIEWASDPLAPTPAGGQVPLADHMPLSAHDADRLRRGEL